MSIINIIIKLTLCRDYYLTLILALSCEYVMLNYNNEIEVQIIIPLIKLTKSFMLKLT
jgi:hypothetical protein